MSLKERQGALFVRRINWRAEKPGARTRQPEVAASEDEIVQAYRGIDGRPWPEEVPLRVPHISGLAPTESWPELLGAADENSIREVHDALVVVSDSQLISNMRIPKGAEFLGFDFGYYDDECSVFSSVYHEIVYASLPELGKYASRLNDSLLFSTTHDVEGYSQTRDLLRKAGRDVENGQCYRIAVFGRPRRG